jgi:ADP-ribose pyrophosphatase YjhB (NUDIX family)
MGLLFSNSPYDRENYHTMQSIAMAMQALATGQESFAIEPLRASLFSRPTPLSTGDAAIFDEQGRILLIQRADNGKWAMPGGALAVGETPGQGVAREALEETGLACEPVALAAVHDSRLCGSVTPHHLYHFTFVCRLKSGVEPQTPAHAHETLGMRWFAECELPPVEATDPGHISRIPEAFRVWKTGGPSYFDR